MFGRNQVSDKDLLKAVNQRLMRAGAGSQSRITAAIQQGTVTLTGALQYAIQRSPLLKEVGRVPGVVRVVDQLTLVDRKTS
jgi:osmotically-inducible protein OsmY